MGVTLWRPAVVLVPLHPPDAVHEVAFVEDHTRSDEAPVVIEVGIAESGAVGTGAGGGGGGTAVVTFTVTFCVTLPPLPVQERVYVVVAVGVTAWVPLVAFAPVQPPLALQEVASVEDQVRVED